MNLFLIILLSFFCTDNLSAQINDKKITITGSVMDVDKRPIVNAIIMIDGQNSGSITDPEGNYKVRSKSGASKIGVFTFGNGYFEEEIGGRTMIDINFNSVAFKHGADWDIVPGELEINRANENNSYYRLMGLQGKNIATGEELVDVGYAQIKRKNLITNIDFIDGTDKKYASCSTIYDMIQRVPGVTVNGKQIIIQSAANLIGFVSPLVIVDGIYVNSDGLDYISPSTVKSISVLKGTSAAIYGSRGYGGAIIIRLKSW